MRKISLFILITTLASCDDSHSDKVNQNDGSKSELEDNHEYADLVLQSDVEKIGLLSIMKGVSYETTNSVLRDYLATTSGYGVYRTNENPEYFMKLIDSIAVKNNLSDKLTASIIFSYKYETFTKEEIMEEYSSQIEDYENEKHEIYENESQYQ